MLALTILGVVGTAVELAMLRHWDGLIQLVPWFSLGVVVIALGLVVVRPGRRSIRAARLLAAVVRSAPRSAPTSLVKANYDAGPLDFRYSERWTTMSATSRWWTAATGTVGPSPSVAPAVLAWSSLRLLLATVGTDARLRSRRCNAC